MESGVKSPKQVWTKSDEFIFPIELFKDLNVELFDFGSDNVWLPTGQPPSQSEAAQVIAQERL